ncbi:MAG: ATP-grasp domain-containing protein [Gemmatimonadota bacterium]|nr:ATP-grasp domain-containing protein [Gemmatimonadota bacterium]
MPANIFVVGLDDFNHEKLETLSAGDRDLRFLPLLSLDEVTAFRGFPLEERLEEASRIISETPGGADAIIGYWDFPVSLMVSLLCRRFGLRGPSYESVLRCEHKYWSRVEQRAAAPDHVPPFVAVDPFDDEAVAAIELDFPFWLKPVKSFASHLGFRIRHRNDLRDAVKAIREGIGDLGEPFNAFLERAELPAEIAEVGGLHCVAEGLISGSQCTLEGFVHRGEVEVYGVVDSIRHANRSTFSRYEYPSRLPRAVQGRMIELARRVVSWIELDDAPFNMELFWDAARDRIWLLEINPRISQSHGDLFSKVDGAPHHRVAVDLALGRRPEWTKGGGTFNRAGKFFLRSFRDARAIRTPTAVELDRLAEELPGTVVEVPLEPGMRLSEMDPQDQDSYSYIYARVHLGAGSQRELMERHRTVTETLPFTFLDEATGGTFGWEEATRGSRHVVSTRVKEHRREDEPAPAEGAQRKRNVFLVGLNEFNRTKLERLDSAADCTFHSLLEEPKNYDLPDYLRRAERRLSAFDGPIDAVVGYMDFPVSTMLPILCRRFGVRSPTLESVLRCEHKYWSRLEQKKAIPEHVPAFAPVNPFDDASVADIPLPYPFWIKPVKSVASQMGFRIGNRKDLARAIARIRAAISQIAEPFNFVLEQADLPPEVEGVDGHYCIAEEIISGRECTLEGWMYQGEMGYHGIVDSIRERNRSTFARYEYPTLLPTSVRSRMVDVGRRILEQVGFDHSAFNMEFEWDQRRDVIRLVEINTRVAQHHSDLFEKVDGVTNHQVPVEIGLGRKPRIPSREGAFARAATFFIRRFQDGIVRSVPDPETIRAVEERIPGTVVQLQVAPGMRLSELFEQDSYSYALAIVYVGARNQRELLERYRWCVAELPFDIEPVASEPAPGAAEA